MSESTAVVLTLGITGYLVVMVFMYFAASELDGPRETVDRVSARLRLTAPIWPVWALIGLWHLFTKTLPRLWKEAQWTK